LRSCRELVARIESDKPLEEIRAGVSSRALRVAEASLARRNDVVLAQRACLRAW
jgi:hypothetical protein